ncbi:MAG: prolyl oligopeptidase family serine peptidase [Gemmatimonadaceae bacterium]
MNSTTSRYRFAAAALALSFSAPTAVLSAQKTSQTPFKLTIENIMRGPELYGREPANVRWSADGQWIYFNWNPPNTKWDVNAAPYRVRAEPGAKPELMTAAHVDSMAPYLADGPTTHDGATRAVSARGDLFLMDTKTGKARQLTSTVALESSPMFSADEKELVFQREGNAYSINLSSGLTKQLTDIRTGNAPTDAVVHATGAQGSLERDQLQLLEVIRDRARADSIARAARALATANVALKPVYVGTDRVVSLNISPTLRTALVVTSSAAGFGGRGGGGRGGAATAPPVQAPPTAAAATNRNTIVPAYVTASGYTEEIPGRTKVGDTPSRVRIGQINLATGAIHWISPTGGDGEKLMTGVQFMDWNADGTSAVMASSTADFKMRYLLAVTGDNAETKTIDVLRDTAWVAGPCGNCGGFLPDGRVWFVSEASGYAQMYAVKTDGTGKIALTEGKWEIERAELSSDNKFFWLHTSEESPFVRHLYKMAVTGGARTKITKEHGGHTVSVSPDGSKIADVFSEANVPPELFVADATDGNRSQLTVSTSDEFRSYKWLKPTIVKIPASDGIQVPARIYRPQDVGAKSNGAAVMFVHGAGYLHNVHDFWSTYPREYMFNHILATKGYTVIDVDYRGSAGYGRDWRTAIYRFMGGRDLQDHVDASKWLTKTYGIPAERIGLYGGSYGGFMTLMALFTAPKYFGAGAAIRSVTDWAHYNHGYTARILNLPQDDTLAYRRSSPIFLAEGLEDPLLMLHGMVDTNVNFEDIVRLTQRLIELGKPNWDLAVYPVEDHGFTRPSSWTDEYTRILKLYDNTIGPNGSKGKRK